MQRNNLSDAYRTERVHAVNDEAERRHAVKQRARELKRGLLESTLRLSPERAAAAYNEAARAARHAKRRSAPVLRLGLAVFSGALSMLIPISNTSTLHGQLSAATLSDGVTVDRHAMVSAQPAQCQRLSVDEPASVSVDTGSSESPRFEAHITRLSPRVGATCQIELQLQARADQATLLRELPADAALVAVFNMQPSHWLAALAEKSANDGTLQHASNMLRGYGELAWQRGLMLNDYVRHDMAVQQHWETLRQIFAPEEQ